MMDMRRRTLVHGSLWVAAIATVAAGAATVGFQLIGPKFAAPHAAAELAPSGWFCPMHPDYASTLPGNCPLCGMALVKTSLGQTVRHGDQFHVSPQVQGRIGVMSDRVEWLSFQPTLAIPAQVVADERGAVTLSPKVDGWIRRLGVSVVGQTVRQGQMLFEIYSPELLQRQRDYLDILTRRDALQAQAGGMGAVVGNSAPDLMMASVARERHLQRSRLAAADVPEAVLADLDKGRRVHEVVPVLAVHDGVVTSIGAREGGYVMPSQPVLGYADLGAVWAELTLTTEQLSLVGQANKVLLRSIDDRSVVETAAFDARQAVVDPVSRTVRIRVPVRSVQRRFLPGTLLEAEIQLTARRALTVKQDAVIRTGHGDFVIVSDDHNHFRQVPVRLGAEAGGEVEVVAGLLPGQKVVTNGQFLLGAEASLQASGQRLNATDRSHADAASQPPAPGPDGR